MWIVRKNLCDIFTSVLSTPILPLKLLTERHMWVGQKFRKTRVRGMQSSRIPPKTEMCSKATTVEQGFARNCTSLYKVIAKATRAPCRSDTTSAALSLPTKPFINTTCGCAPHSVFWKRLQFFSDETYRRSHATHYNVTSCHCHQYSDTNAALIYLILPSYRISSFTFLYFLAFPVLLHDKNHLITYKNDFLWISKRTHTTEYLLILQR